MVFGRPLSRVQARGGGGGGGVSKQKEDVLFERPLILLIFQLLLFLYTYDIDVVFLWNYHMEFFLFNFGKFYCLNFRKKT